ncbi:MAG: hypothetical protein CL676_01800 [Bdellovibrionaceae bacterium]|nr:hypothetical protein [Pseudobdellovibrionaceae bacterium]
MQLSLSAILLLIFTSISSQAADILPIYSSTRALGMGNAHYGLVDDSASLFYNPAGLARFRGISWKIFGVGAGVGTDVISNVDKVQGFSDETQFADTLSSLYGKKISTTANGNMALTLPFVSVAAYNHTYLSAILNNPVYPELPLRFINDYGYAIGLGIPIFPFMHGGIALKRIKRSGVEKTYKASNLTDLNPETIKSDLTQWGVGYAMDIGGNFYIDAPFVDIVLSSVWQNVGDTQFRSDNNSDIPPEKSNLGVGAAVLIDLPLISVSPAIDINHLNRADVQLMRKINLGVEVGLPLIDLRAGFQQGYYTLGAGFGLGPIQIDAASYGVELGEYPGQIEDRRYMVELSLELGIRSLAFGKNSSSGSASRGSIWGGRRLKQRR